MKKSTFVAMMLGMIGGILFALGMCMVSIPEWNAFRPGVITGVTGMVILLIMVMVWRRMENKAPVRLSGKTVGAALIGAAVRCRHVPDHGVEPHGHRHYHRDCRNRGSFLSDPVRKRIQAGMIRACGGQGKEPFLPGFRRTVGQA